MKKSVLIESKIVNSIPAAFDVVAELGETWSLYDPSYLWFRGSRNQKNDLVPGAYWRGVKSEWNIMADFVRKASVYEDLTSIDEWPTYYLAQHHGIPTRLLDWTESFAAALYFAFDGWNGRTIPCVWVMQPYALNDCFIQWDGIIDPENVDELKLWLTRAISEDKHKAVQDKGGYVYNNNWPLALYPKITNHRLRNQQGVFTVHGRKEDPLPELIDESGNNPKDVITRIDFKGIKRERVRHDILALGLRRSAIYPDIDNLVKEIQEEFGW